MHESSSTDFFLYALTSDVCILNNVCLLTFGYQDIAGTLATEAAEEVAQVTKLRSALESVDHKRRKVFF